MSFGSSYFTLPKFKYCRPGTVDELLELLSDHGGNGKVMSGGVGLLAFMKERLVSPEYVFSISGIPELKKVEAKDNVLSIGANVHLSELESDFVRRNVPTLYRAVKNIADPTVRNMGTIVGDLAEALPWADAYPALISLGAEVEIMKKNSSRRVPVEGLVQGLGQINIGEDEFISKVLIPLRKTRGTYLKFANGSEYGLATLALTYFEGEKRINVVIGSVSETPVVIRDSDVGWDFGQDLSRNAERLEKHIDENVNPADDILASSAFRKNVIKFLVVQALKEVFAYERG
mgnify:CR=1 FL=1